jgi:hypothetical protein
MNATVNPLDRDVVKRLAPVLPWDAEPCAPAFDPVRVHPNIAICTDGNANARPGHPA